MSYACSAPKTRDIKSGAIRIWPVQSVSREGAVNQFGIIFCEALIVESRTAEAAGAHIGQKDVSVQYHLLKNGVSVR